ncbi:sodium-independent sulfate anion transporter-like [Physella acuta]|uniref:sodium-independent sulfate anion transporter-like n=1 Tax=Physella acuta TaxID=109671 RepID=UPI0027DBC14F|nr:sodium-independent sulfate anion transporter-like [Physella acuta]
MVPKVSITIRMHLENHSTSANGLEVVTRHNDVTGAVVREKIKRCCQETFTLDNLLSKFPIVRWLPKYRLATLQCDVIAGLTVGLTVIPQGLAYAQIAYLPPQYGLYSAFVGCFIYCLLGTSKDITLGPTALLSLMTATFGTSFSPDLPTGGKDPTAAIILTLTSGIIQLIMGILKLGILVNFISHPVITAFTSAAAITIAVGQVKNALGLTKIPNHFMEMVYYTCKKIPETKLGDMTVAILCLIAVVCMKKLREVKWRKPGDTERKVSVAFRMLQKCVWTMGTAANAIVVIVAAGVVAIMENNGHNGTVTVTGNIQAGFPTVGFPKFKMTDGNITMSAGEIFSNIGIGVAIVPLLALVETMAIGKAFARDNNYKIDPTQELLAIGASNIVSSFFQSYPLTGSFARTAVNSQSGVKTPLSGVWTGGLVILALCVLTPWFYYIPRAALAAVIIAAVLPMVEYRMVVKLWRTDKWDIIPYVITFVCSLLIGIEYGILIGKGVSLVLLLYPLARPKFQFTSGRGFLIVTPLQGLNFPAAEHMESQVLDKTLEGKKPQWILLNLERLTDLDYTAIQSLETLATDCGHHGVKLLLASPQGRVIDQLQNVTLKHVPVYSTIAEAMSHQTAQDELEGTAEEEVPFVSQTSQNVSEV